MGNDNKKDQRGFEKRKKMSIRSSDVKQKTDEEKKNWNFADSGLHCMMGKIKKSVIKNLCLRRGDKGKN